METIKYRSSTEESRNDNFWPTRENTAILWSSNVSALWLGLFHSKQTSAITGQHIYSEAKWNTRIILIFAKISVEHQHCANFYKSHGTPIINWKTKNTTPSTQFLNLRKILETRCKIIPVTHICITPHFCLMVYHLNKSWQS